MSRRKAIPEKTLEESGENEKAELSINDLPPDSLDDDMPVEADNSDHEDDSSLRPDKDAKPPPNISQSIGRAQKRLSFPGFFGTVPRRKRPEDGWFKYVYLILLIGGFFAILIAKSLGVPAGIIAILACVLIVIYGFSGLFLFQKNRMRVDRTGDNCYYLGLTYTLASLISALFLIGDDTISITLLGNFGIALYSTAAGIIMRLMLMQFRTELDDAEVEARQRLMAASEDFRQQLHSVTGEFGLYHVSTKMSLARMQEDVLSLLKSHSHNLAESMSKSLDVMEKRVKMTDDLLGVFESRFDVLEAYTGRLGEAAKKLAERMDDVHTEPEKIDVAFSALHHSLTETHELIKTSVENLYDKAETTKNFDEIIERLSSRLINIDAVVAKMEENISSQSESIRIGTEAMKAHSEALENYSSSTEEEARKMREAVHAVYGALGDLANTVIKGVNRG